MDATIAAKLVRSYFEVTLNTSAFFIEPVTSNFSQSTQKWIVEVILKPIYGGEKKFRVIINPETEDVEDVKRIE